MREIEFRGKKVESRKWVFGYYHKLNESFENKDCILEHHRNTSTIIDVKTLGQYTGHKDKNGTKIFEGDLLYYRNSNHDEEDGAMEVVFEDGAFMIAGDILVPLHETYSWELEVIGNIYDNPELVEVDNA